MDDDHQDDDQKSCDDGYATPAGLSFSSTNPRQHGKDRHPLLTIVDRSGIHEIGVNWCCCSEAPEHEMQLMMVGLFPATFRNPKMAFTFRVLEDFHLDNLECKTTPSQYFSRLRRLTNDQFPNIVPVSEFNTSVNGRLISRHRIDIGSY